MKVTITGLKTMSGHESSVFILQLHVDGVRVAQVSDDGHGGSYRYECVAPGFYKRQQWWSDLVQWLRKERPACVEHLDGSQHFEDFAVDAFIASLIDAQIENRKLRRLCKNKVLFRLKTDAPGVWRALPCDWAKEGGKAREQIVQTYADALDEIANERFIGGAA